MGNQLYQLRSYKLYLKDAFGTTRGIRSRFATALSCQPAFVSQVINGDKHLSLEQAEVAARFLNLTSEDTLFFLLLVQWERAGTKKLQQFFETQLQQIVQKNMQLRNIVESKTELQLKDQTHYYSAWYYSAVHIALTIPALRTAENLSRELKLPLHKVRHILEFLTKCGLAEIGDGSQYKPGKVSIHLGNDSKLIQQHHINWRLKSMQSLETLHENPDLQESLHYSSVISLSHEDVLRLRSKITDWIKEAKTLIKKSKEERLFSFNLDFYDLI